MATPAEQVLASLAPKSQAIAAATENKTIQLGNLTVPSEQVLVNPAYETQNNRNLRNQAALEKIKASNAAVRESDKTAWRKSDEDGVWPWMKDTAARISTVSSRIVNETINAPSSIRSAARASLLTEKTADIGRRDQDYLRYQELISQPGSPIVKDERDLALLNNPPQPITQEESEYLNQRPVQTDEQLRGSQLGGSGQKEKATTSIYSRKELLDKIDKSAEFRKKVDKAFENSLSVKGIVQKNKQNRLDNAVQKDFEVMDGEKRLDTIVGEWKEGNKVDSAIETAKLIGDMTTSLIENGANNKIAVTGYIAEVIPYMMAGMYGSKDKIVGGKEVLAGINAAYAGNIYSDGVEHYKKENNGEIPVGKNNAEIATWSAAAGSVELAGNLTLLGTLRPKTMSLEAANKILTRGAARNTLNKTVAATGTTAKAAVVESATEVGQTSIEDNFSKLNRDFDVPKLVHALAAGFYGGGGVAAPGAAINALTTPDNTTQKAKKRVNSNLNKIVEKAFESVNTGDVADLVDKDKPETYSPLHAASALKMRLENPNLTEDEKVEATETLNNVIKDSEQVMDDLASKIETITPLTIQKRKNNLKKVFSDLKMLKEQKDSVPPVAEGEPALSKKEIAKEIKRKNIAYRKAEKLAKAARKNQETKIKEEKEFLATKPVKQLVAMRKAMNDVYSQQDNAGEKASEPVVAAADSVIDSADATPEQKEEAAQQTVSYMLNNEVFATPERAQRLLDSNLTGFTPQQTEYLKAMLDAPAGDSKVSKEVTDGQSKGLASYAKRIASAVRLNDKNTADKQQTDIKEWLTSTVSKKKAVDSADAAFKAGPQGKRVTQYVYKTDANSNEWTTSDVKPANFKELQGLTFEGRQKNIVEEMGQEVKAIKAMDRQIAAAIDLKWNNQDATQPAPESTPTRGSQEAAATPTQETAQSTEQDTLNESESVAPTESTPTALTTENTVEPASVSVADGQPVAATQSTPEVEATKTQLTELNAINDNGDVNFTPEVLTVMNADPVSFAAAVTALKAPTAPVEPVNTETAQPAAQAPVKAAKPTPKKKKQTYAEKVFAKYRAIIDDPDSSTFKKINAAASLLKNAKTAGNTNQAAEAQAVLAEFKEQGYETTLAVGDNYNEGMRVVANFVPDDSLYEDEQIIQKIVKPQINKDGKMVQAGSIVVSQGTKVREQPTTTVARESARQPQEVNSSESGVEAQPEGQRRTDLVPGVVEATTSQEPQTSATAQEAEPQVQAKTAKAPAREQITINLDDYKLGIDALDAALKATINTAQRTVSRGEVKEATAGGFYSMFKANISRHYEANGAQPGKSEEIRKKVVAETLGEVDIHEQVTRALRTHTSLEIPLTRFIRGRADMAETVNGILGSLSGTKDFQALPAEVMGPIVEEYLNTLPLIQVSKKGENASAPVTDTSSLQEKASDNTQESASNTSVKNVAQEETDALTAETGRSKVLLKETKEEAALPFKEANLIKRWVTQGKKKASDITKHALVAQKDFFATLLRKDGQGAQILQDLIGNEELTPEQKQLLFKLAKYTQAWRGKISNNMSHKAVHKTWSDKAKYFKEPILNEAGEIIGYEDLEANIEDAMVTAAFQYLVEHIRDTGFNTESEIQYLLGLDSNSSITASAVSIYGEGWGQNHALHNEIGKNVISILNLKLKNDPSTEPPLDVMNTLATSFGATAVGLLLQEGILEQRSFTQQEYLEATGQSDAPMNRIVAYRIRRDYAPDKRNKGTAPLISLDNGLPPLSSMLEQVVGSTALFVKLFGAEAGKKFPTFTPQQNEQNKTSKSMQEMPKLGTERLNAHNNTAYQLKETMAFLVEELGEQFTKLAMGWVDVDSNPEIMHKVDRESQQAVNAEIERAIDQFNEFKEILKTQKDGAQTPFYLQSVMWINQRVGYVQNAINPQTSKFIRHMIGASAYKQTIQFDGTEKDTQLQNIFLLAVAQNLGFKIENTKNTDTVAILQDEMSQPNNVRVQSIMANLLDPGRVVPVSAEDSQALLDFVASRKEKFAVVDALSQYVQFMDAANNNVPFEANIMMEIDGVANGPALLHMLLGTRLEDFGEAFGFFTKDSEHESFADYKKEGLGDFYEKTTVRLKGYLANYLSAPWVKSDKEKYESKNKKNKQVLSIVSNFISESEKPLIADGKATAAGRKFSKGPLTPLMFGSSGKKAFSSLAESILDNYTGIILSLKNNPQELERFLTDLNFLTKKQAGKQDGFKIIVPGINTKMSWNQAMEFELSTRQYNSAKETIYNALEPSTDTLITNYFSELMERRDAIATASSTAHAQYNLAYTLARKQYIDELIEQGLIATPDNGKAPLHDLTATQEAEVRRRVQLMEPTVHSRMSKQENNPGAGLRMSKMGFASTDGFENAYKTKTYFNSPINVATRLARLTEEEVNETREFLQSYAQKLVEQEPGAGTTPAGTHSTDSNIASKVYGKFKALNVHDALGVSIADAVDVAKDLNKETFVSLVEYSLPTEVVTSAERVNRQFKEWVAANPELKNEIDRGINEYAENTIKRNKDLLEGVQNKDVADAVISNLAQIAEQAEIAKLQHLHTLRVVNQYNFEDGGWSVTPEWKANIEARLIALNAPLTAPVASVSTVETANPKTEPDMPSDSASGAQVGMPVKQPDSKTEQNINRRLKTILTKLPNLTAKSIIAHLNQQMDKTTLTPTEQAYKTLLPKLNEIVDPDIAIVYVTKDMKMPKGTETAYGWFNPNSTKDYPNGAIFIKSDEHTHSNVSAELIAHELLHASVKTQMFNARKRKNKTAADKIVLAAVDNLEVIRKAAEDYIASNNLEGFGNAVNDVDELIAWGITNERFQKEVLGQLVIDNKKLKETGLENSVKNGIKQFIKAIGQILNANLGAKANTAASINALQLVFANTAAVMSTVDSRGVQALSNKQRISKQDSGAPISFSHRRVFEALGNSHGAPSTPRHVGRMASALEQVVETVYGPFGMFQAEAERSSPAIATDVFLQSLANKTKPFTSKALGVLQLNDQEAFTLESVELVMKEALETDTIASLELAKVFEEVRNSLSATDFYSGDVAQAQEIYDFIFNADQRIDEKRSDYLSRFSALAVAYAPLASAMDQLTVPESENQQGSTLLEKVSKVVKDAFNRLRKIITRTSSANTQSQRHAILAKNLATIRKKEAARLQKDKTVLNIAENTIDTLAEKGKNKLVSVLASNRFNNKSTIIKAFSSIGQVALSGQGEAIVKTINKVRNELTEGKQGVLMNIVTDLQGRTIDSQIYHTLLNAANRHMQQRQQTTKQISKLVVDAFSRPLNKDESVAVTELIRTDLSDLVTTYSMKELQELFDKDQTILDSRIKELSSQLTGKNKLYYLYAAKALADHMMTSNTHENQVQNVYQIARMDGFSDSVPASEQKDLVKILNPLVTLLSIKYMEEAPANSSALSGASKKSMLRKLFELENNRLAEDGTPDVNKNGIEYVLRLHASMKKDALKSSFDNDPSLMKKGYVREINNPNISIKAADPFKGKELERAGYKKVWPYNSPLPVDEDAVTSNYVPQHLYIAKGLGLQKVVSGIVSNKNTRAKGSLAGIDNNGEFSRARIVEITAKKGKKLNSLKAIPENWDPRSDRKTRLAPIWNPKGNIVGWRQLMKETTKDALMSPDRRIDQVLGATAGSIFDKAGSEAINKKVVEAHYKQYQEDYLANPNSYIHVHENSKDPEIAERAKLLPKTTKRQINAVWGKTGLNGMMIKNDVYNMSVGYRKYSITEGYDKKALSLKAAIKTAIPYSLNDEQQRTIVEQVTIGIATKLGVSQLRVKQTEDLWQEIVGVVKDILVVKNLVTFLGNLSSNATLLAWSGVPINKIIAGHIKGFIDINRYEKDEKRLFELKNKLETGYFAGALERNVRQDIVRLENALERNPVHSEVQAGLYQTIVEDGIETDDDPYSMKSALMASIDEKTQKVPKLIKNGVKIALMTHDTALYKMLHKGTQYSDFIGRLVLIEHLQTRKKDPLSIVAARNRAQDSFVNYDIPQHKGLQYLNDTGLIWFTKYYIRIQKTIINLLREKPARALGLAAVEAYFPALQSLLDSVATEKIANPFGAGAFEIVDTWDDAITMQVLMDSLGD